jgi:hypothetical protein
MVYRIVSGKAEMMKKNHANTVVNIILTGELNGLDVNEKFNDVESYFQYLQTSHLMPASQKHEPAASSPAAK